MQPVSSNVGGPGSGLGYAGITPSVGVEFDIFFNGASDTSTNHVGVDLNGNVNSVAKIHVDPRWDDGNRWYAWVDYDGMTLEVRANQTGIRPTDPLLSHMVDIATVLGQEEAFVGFTAGTGSAWANHDVLTWTYFDLFNPGGTTTTTTTTSTSTSAPPTTTTIVGDDPCATEPEGPTFRSLACRLAALLEATQDADALGGLLLVPPRKGEGSCGRCRGPVRGGQRAEAEDAPQAARAAADTVQPPPPRQTGAPRVPEEIREPLAQAADAIRADARMLRSGLRCPEHARGA